MKTVKRILFAFLALVVIGVIAGIIFVNNLQNRALPDYNENMYVAGLNQEVSVYRDSMGIPHIYAQNEHDLYLTTGYIMAQERLWQMDLLRRVTTGRLAEIFGKEFIDTDVLLRALDYPRKSKWVLDSCNQNIVVSLEAFAQGVNNYIADHYNQLPPEFAILGYKPEPWEPIHSVNLIGYMAWDLEAGWSPFMLHKFKTKLDSVRWNQLLPNIESRETVVYPNYDHEKAEIASTLLKENEKLRELQLDIFSGSNNWTVSGDKTRSGKPILANDMHLGLNLPGIWMQIHQHVQTGSLHVTGVAVPGQPFVICGHNDSIAWGMTNAFVDNVDFYEEKLNEDSTKYLYQERWFDIEQRPVSIKTKEDEIIKDTIWFTHRGPIVNRFKDYHQRPISMHWVGHEYSNEIQTVFLLNRAHNWQEFLNAARTFKSISQNINYADTRGNIGLFYAAGIPVRKRLPGYHILPGWTDEFDWQGFVPFQELPYSYNPTDGFVASANVKTVGNDYPYHIGSWYSMPYRMNRINELLEKDNSFTSESMKAVQTDLKSDLASTYTEEIIRSVNKNNDLSETEEQALSILQDWDYQMKSGSSAAFIFEDVYQNLIDLAFSDEMGDSLFHMYLSVSKLPKIGLFNIWQKADSPWWDDVHTDNTELKTDIISAAFRKSINRLQNQFGNDPGTWEWGKVHQLTLEHPLGSVEMLDKAVKLNRGPYPVGGSYHTVMPYSYSFTNPYNPDHGASQRHIYDLADWDNSWTIIPTGTSGIPSSPYYANQTETYIQKKYHRDLFSKESVMTTAVYVQNYLPKVE